jgi:hypothetical protein
VNDDWRLEIDLDEESHLGHLLERLEARELEHDLSDAFQDRVIVSRDGDRVFLYAGTREQLEKAAALVDRLAQEHDWSLSSELRRWHPLAGEWEDPDAPIPDDEAGRRAEHDRLIAAERGETEQRGHPEFEVRVDLPSRREAAATDEKLRAEGLPTVHRGRYLLIGAGDEDSARALAERLKSEVPPGSTVRVEGTWQAAYAERPANPFAIFGGLGS